MLCMSTCHADDGSRQARFSCRPRPRGLWASLTVPGWYCRSYLFPTDTSAMPGLHVTDTQVRLDLNTRTRHTQAAAAAIDTPRPPLRPWPASASGAARQLDKDPRLPSQGKARRSWRTREDPLIAVWPRALEMLNGPAGLMAVSILETPQEVRSGHHAGQRAAHRGAPYRPLERPTVPTRKGSSGTGTLTPCPISPSPTNAASPSPARSLLTVSAILAMRLTRRAACGGRSFSNPLAGGAERPEHGSVRDTGDWEFPIRSPRIAPGCTSDYSDRSKSLFSIARKGGASILNEGDHLGLHCPCRLGLSCERWQVQRLDALRETLGEFVHCGLGVTDP